MTCNHPFDYLSFLILKMSFSISSYILAITNLVLLLQCNYTTI